MVALLGLVHLRISLPLSSVAYGALGLCPRRGEAGR
jgi:hypothetical protein